MRCRITTEACQCFRSFSAVSRSAGPIFGTLPDFSAESVRYENSDRGAPKSARLSPGLFGSTVGPRKYPRAIGRSSMDRADQNIGCTYLELAVGTVTTLWPGLTYCFHW